MNHNDTERWCQIVKEAAYNEGGRENLRSEIVPFVERATRQFLKSRSLPESLTEELLESGMAPFDHAFNAYVRNWVKNYPHHDFRDYYRWWVRQAIVERLVADGNWPRDKNRQGCE